MLIYLDIDGTVVEHQYPAIGHYNSGCLEVIEKLIKAGHEIVINTMRVEFGNGTLEDALEYVNRLTNPKGEKILPHGIKYTDHKFEPTMWNWELHINSGCIFIDDVCEGIPLKDGITLARKMVDWKKLELEFIEYRII
jgi:hypothetical protein